MNTITVTQLKKMILQAGKEIEENEGMLSELDAAIGDGDHGVSMTRGVRAVRVKIETADYADLSSFLTDCGKVLMKEIGGTCGPLFATFYLKMASCVPGKTEVGLSEWAAMLSLGLNGVKTLGKADVGDKTMIDALEPAVRFVEACAGEAGSLQDRDGSLEKPSTNFAEHSGSLQAVLKGAADAAAEGAKQTINLVARKGRGRYQGDTSSGHQDAGATSIALIFKGFSDVWQS